MTKASEQIYKIEANTWVCLCDASAVRITFKFIVELSGVGHGVTRVLMSDKGEVELVRRRIKKDSSFAWENLPDNISAMHLKVKNMHTKGERSIPAIKHSGRVFIDGSFRIAAWRKIPGRDMEADYEMEALRLTPVPLAEE